MIDQAAQPVVPPDKVAALRQELDGYFHITATALDSPEPGCVRFRGLFIDDIPDVFDALRSRFERHGFTPIVRQDNSELSRTNQVALIGMPHVFRTQDVDPQVNIYLLVATFLTLLFAGTASEATELIELIYIWRGWPFMVSMIAILAAHELGHFLVARKHNAPYSLPYFIPFPSFLIATFGAITMQHMPIKNKKIMFDMAIAGPLAGFAVSLVVLVAGIATAELIDISEFVGGYLEGNSLLYLGIKYLRFGLWLPTETFDIEINQLTRAGWLGMLITSLSLIPAGLLDGGQISYALFGEKIRPFFWPILVFIALLALIIPDATFQWGIWTVILYFVGRQYSLPLDDITPLDQRRKILGAVALVILILTFVPIPIQIIGL